MDVYNTNMYIYVYNTKTIDYRNDLFYEYKKIYKKKRVTRLAYIQIPENKAV